MKKPSSHNLAYLLASRLKSKQGSLFSASVTKIAIGSVALGLAVMIIADSVFNGFQENIVERVLCFSSHIQVTPFSSSEQQQSAPMPLNTRLYQNNGLTLPMPVRSVSAFIQKPGLLRSKQEMMGTVFKGVDDRFDSTRFNEIVTRGQISFLYDSTSNYQVAISQFMADRLLVDIGSDMVMYFIQTTEGQSSKQPRPRRLEVAAIYETGMEEFDESIIFGRLDIAQRLSNWGDSLAGGYDIYLPSLDDVDPATAEISYQMGYNYMTLPITTSFEHYFAWFDILSQNVMVVILFIGGVVCINIISVLVILIMEKTQFIGTLKALGAQDSTIQMIFFYLGVKLCLKGILIGSILGVGLSLLQKTFGFLPLDQTTYYMKAVPVKLDWGMVAIYIMIIQVLFTIIEYLTTLIVSRVKPIQSIKFN